MEEFNLSNYIKEDMYIGKPEDEKEVKKSGELLSVPVSKIKEFIKELKEEIHPNKVNTVLEINDYLWIIKKINKLAGDKLTK